RRSVDGYYEPEQGVRCPQVHNIAGKEWYDQSESQDGDEYRQIEGPERTGILGYLHPVLELQLHAQNGLSIGHSVYLPHIHHCPVEVGDAFHVYYGDEIPLNVYGNDLADPFDLLQAIVDCF